MSLPTNIVIILCNAATTPVFVDGSFVISQNGKAELPPKISPVSGGWSISIDCDRNPSAQVAEEFIHASGGDNHCYSDSTIKDVTPSELSFYFAFDFSFVCDGTTYTQRIYFGQGKRFGGHNWWIGAPAIVCRAGGDFKAAESVFVIMNAARNAVVQMFAVGNDDWNKFSLPSWFGDASAGPEKITE